MVSDDDIIICFVSEMNVGVPGGVMIVGDMLYTIHNQLCTDNKKVQNIN